MTSTYQGEPCQHGHTGERYKSNRACVACTRERAAGRPTTRAARTPLKAAARSTVKRVRAATPSPAGLDALLDPAWEDGAYAVTISHKGRRPDGRPAGYAVTIHATGERYTTESGAMAVPTLTHKADGDTASDALAHALAKAAGLFRFT